MWAALLLAAWVARPLLPIDETRYASVAWEMWLRHDLLVPHVNGAPYSDKPPLLFWLILAGWKAFGVGEWWLRLVPALFGLGSLVLTVALGRRLWPAREQPARDAPWVLLGTAVWSVYCTLLLFDMLIAFFALLGLLGVVEARRGGGVGGWLLLGLAIGLGILAKGPVMLVHVLGPALLAPWWSADPPRRWSRWYLGAAGAVALGAAIALAWAVPAARAGGPEYGSAILWGQTAGRIVHSAAHARPVWWYLALLPALAVPWSLAPAIWRGLARLARGPKDEGVRFCLAWLVPGLAVLSLISGKQLHYLLPLLVPFALLVARSSVVPGAEPRRLDRLLPAALFMAIAASALAAPLVKHFPAWTGAEPPFWMARVSWPAGVALALAAAGFAAVRAPRRPWPALAATSVLVVALLHLAVMRAAAPAYDVEPAARAVRRLQDEGRPVANAGRYDAQFQFLGRLRRPIDVIDRRTVAAWLARHPDGAVVTYLERWPRGTTVTPYFMQPYQDRVLAIFCPQCGRRAGGRPLR